MGKAEQGSEKERRSEAAGEAVIWGSNGQGEGGQRPGWLLILSNIF